MSRRRRFPTDAGSIPPLKIVYKETSILNELEAVPTDDMATKLTLRALGEELVFEEGLDITEGASDDGDSIVIPIDEFEE